MARQWKIKPFCDTLYSPDHVHPHYHTNKDHPAAPREPHTGASTGESQFETGI